MALGEQLFKAFAPHRTLHPLAQRQVRVVPQDGVADRAVGGVGAVHRLDLGLELDQNLRGHEESGEDRRLAQPVLARAGGQRRGAGRGHRHRRRRLAPPLAPRLAEGAPGLLRPEQVAPQPGALVAVMPAERGVADAPDHGPQVAVEGGAAFGTVQHLALRLAPPEEGQHRLSPLHDPADRPRPVRAQHVVGILPRRHQREPQRLARLDQRQGEVDDPARRPLPRRVAVERDHRLGREAPEEAQLLLRHRRAEGGDGRRKARL